MTCTNYGQVLVVFVRSLEYWSIALVDFARITARLVGDVQDSEILAMISAVASLFTQAAEVLMMAASSEWSAMFRDLLGATLYSAPSEKIVKSVLEVPAVLLTELVKKPIQTP